LLRLMPALEDALAKLTPRTYVLVKSEA